MKQSPSKRFKEIKKSFNDSDASIFFTKQDLKDMRWLVRRVKKLEKALEFYADDRNQVKVCVPPLRGWIDGTYKAREALGKV